MSFLLYQSKEKALRCMRNLNLFFKKWIKLFDASLYDNTTPYGLNAALREMTDFPKWLALPVWQQHGFYPATKILSHDYECAKTKGIMLLFNSSLCEAWRENSRIPCYTGGLFLARYRHFKQWRKKMDAQGTIFFAAHSIQEARANYSIEKIHKELSALPAEFQPVVISLHYYDYEVLHTNIIYENLGYKVVTAGSPASSQFPARFYDNLLSCKYACSNDLGTFILYALEADIPFFLVGPIAEHIYNEKGKDGLAVGKYLTMETDRGQSIYELFNTGPVKEISQRQKTWLEKEAGIGEEIDLNYLRREMLRLTYCVPATVRTFILHIKNGIQTFYHRNTKNIRK